MRLLFVTHRFFPDCDAATRCVANLLSSMNSEGVITDVVHLVTVRQGPPSPDQVIRLGEAFPCFCPGCADHDDFALVLQQGAFSTVRCLFLKLFQKLEWKLSPMSRYCGLNGTMYRAFLREIRAQLRHRNYDAVIATLCPAEGALAAAKAAGTVPFFLYQLDPYTDNLDKLASQREARRQLEQQLYQKSKAVFATPLICESKRASGFPGWEKCRGLEFPLVVPRTTAALRKAPRFLGVFAGTLYPSIRPADDLVQLAALLQDKPVDFCCLGSGMSYLLKSPFWAPNQSNIRCLGKLPPQQAEGYVGEADFLINIDNRASNQVPSKIFEYISTGKPIVNLYYDPKSPSLSYFSRYPQVLNLLCDPDHIEENAVALWRFVRECRRLHVGAESIEREFFDATPAAVAHQMLNAIRG